ncbi:hypothetical protein LX99_00835 [Mucilaginibacter oryzae]|uniref:DUF4468 domain-containing protein n=1 Tax=Mucilaginibacter oryzae TaxID=468058 RepID=A0A316HGM2_9SPHI|nr:hypothetical protein [Mucilaginibacter oryzae]PWK80369.1 hypothetical protein LX99_00835 [Mucilaginibacter oryzae]
MKKTLVILLLSTIGTFTCKAQLIHSTEDVKLILPKGTYKLTKQEVDALPGIKLSNKINQSGGMPYNYQLGSLYIGLFNVNKDSMNNDLPREKRFQDEGHLFLQSNGNNSYNSVIKRMGKNHVLLISYTINDTGYYRFNYQNEAKTFTQAGKIEYPIADKEKATALLNEILNSIQFIE